MNKGGGVGIGSASIVLVFAVLCLSVFSLIAHLVAGNDKALVDAEATLVKGYYEADALAERILAEILETGAIPFEVRGVDISMNHDTDSGVTMVEFSCPVIDSENPQINMEKELNVKIAFYEDSSYEIRSWKMEDTDTWASDEGLNVWLGD